MNQNVLNLVQQYSDEKVYTETMNSSNPLVRKEILDLELQNIPMSCITRFKLAMQLAEYYKDKLNLLYVRRVINQSSSLPDKNISNQKPDAETIFPAFYFYLEYYSYNKLLDWDSGMIDRGLIQLIEDLIERAIEISNNELYGDMSAIEVECEEDELKNFAAEVRKLKNLGDLHETYLVFRKKNTEVKTTLSWRRYQKEFLEYLKLT